jgi:hypothetical protein
MSDPVRPLQGKTTHNARRNGESTADHRDNTMR